MRKFRLMINILAFMSLALHPSLVGGSEQSRPDILIADFEGNTYGEWKVTGTAFGPGPARGTLPDQMPVTGFRGRGLVNSFSGGDESTGTLTSPPFRIERRWINFLVGGGKHPGQTCMNLLIEGKVVRTVTGPNDKPGGSERLAWASWHVAEFEGQTAILEIVDHATGGWGHITVDHIFQSDESMEVLPRTDVLYDETYRPLFHFSARHGWINDPNGLVYYDGEYHLFFQHNPLGNEWGNMTWGHAVSTDLIHWKQLRNAIEPDELGTIFSGSAVVDHENTSGFGTSSQKALVAIYTAAGGTSTASQGKPFTQCIAYSTNRGRTWTKYAGNPVLGHIIGTNRDPKVVWHAPTRHWIMALYLDGNQYALYRSPDLKRWEELQRFTLPECIECPDFFELPVVEDPSERKWVFTGANGRYVVGEFDGQRFTFEGQPLQVDYGSNFYAVQTFSDIPSADGRRIQLAWMSGGAYPGMPFNQQLSFPCVLTLRKTEEGLRLFRWPVKEISLLYDGDATVERQELKDGQVFRVPLEGELWDIELTLEPSNASRVIIEVRGEQVVWESATRTLHSGDRSAPVPLNNGQLRLRILVDRTSLEVFAQNGRVSMTSCALFHPKERGVTLLSEGGHANLLSLTARKLKSAWSPDRTPAP